MRPVNDFRPVGGKKKLWRLAPLKVPPQLAEEREPPGARAGGPRWR